MCKCNISTFLVDHLKTHGHYNLILLPKSPDNFATDILLMINWSIADQWLIKYQWMPQKFGCHLLIEAPR